MARLALVTTLLLERVLQSPNPISERLCLTSPLPNAQAQRGLALVYTTAHLTIAAETHQTSYHGQGKLTF